MREGIRGKGSKTQIIITLFNSGNYEINLIEHGNEGTIGNGGYYYGVSV